MKLSFRNPLDKPHLRFGRTATRLRVRRGALPSSLMGLVAFSFTLLVFSAVVYTSSLPGLVMARARAGEDGLFPVIAQALFGDDGGLGTGSQKDEADGSADEGSVSKSSSNKSGAANRPGFTLGGAVLQGVGKPAGGAQGSKPGDSDKPGEGDGSGKPDGGDPDVPGDGGGSGDGNSDGSGGDGDGGDGQQPEEPRPTPEEEQAAYEFLLGKAQTIDGYVAEVNACVASFNQDSLASSSTRKSHKATCDALSARLFNDFATTLNTTLVKPGSAYSSAKGSLIGMFRCLLEYLGTIQEAWDINVGFDDPAAHVDEFMFPINRDTVNGQNVHLTEFYTYYNGFVL